MTSFHISACQCPGLTFTAHGQRLLTVSSYPYCTFVAFSDRTNLCSNCTSSNCSCFMLSCGRWLLQVMAFLCWMLATLRTLVLVSICDFERP